ncbi:ATP-binding protein [Persicobacter psychrovividus]|uniref:ATPase AAA n=1 Tax=Persicobacter psychrovividus TaxID=387638 RepID=A0ABM7VLX0_9BACT|nr:ATPase AAA [Persicobacter psychrovividus]
MQTLRNKMMLLLRGVNSDFIRYLDQEINWENQMTAIVGARGVGKTTLLLQKILQHAELKEVLYVKVDDLYFAENKLLDLAIQFEAKGGKYLFIDEVHKYQNWSQELKDIYDYIPSLKVVFTGSSILDIYKGNADLSRRVITYHMHGLSFREYLSMVTKETVPTFTLDDILNHRYQAWLLKSKVRPLNYYHDYLAHGYYPFFKENQFSDRLSNVTNLIMEVDIPQFAGLQVGTIHKLKSLLYIISKSVPFKPNVSKLSELIGVSRPVFSDLMIYLEKAGLIMSLKNPAEGIKTLRKVEKVYLQNPSLMNVIAEQSPDVGNLRETFIMNQLQVKHQVEASSKADFLIDGKWTFEVGGKNKKMKQIQGLEDAFVVKDDIEYGEGQVIPLWVFGLTY